MKKKLMSLLIVGGFLLGVLAPMQSAHADAPQTTVTGVINDLGSPPQPVAGAMVTVVCNGVTKTDTTDASGAYLVNFTAAQCPLGSALKITAKKGTMSGGQIGAVVGVTTKLNLGIVNVSIPEYGLIGGVLAATAGVGAILFARRRYSQQGMNL